MGAVPPDAKLRDCGAAFNARQDGASFRTIKRLAGERTDGSVTLAFCWAHMRRGFYEFHASTGSPLAAEVLAHRYGDCKDHASLLEALLRSGSYLKKAAILRVKTLQDGVGN